MLNKFNLGNHRGLSEEEAAARIRESGYNEIPAAPKRSIFTIAFEVLREPMFLMLVGGGAIYLILGDVHEALMLLGFVSVVMGITLYQERKVERPWEPSCWSFGPSGAIRIYSENKSHSRPGPRLI